ncbi:MAG: DUF5060 domain-containing protein [Chloroflexota bacterium]|nr:MAG: DUF5060 domain-containing protein [Chloroflexota bacterium]
MKSPRNVLSIVLLLSVVVQAAACTVPFPLPFSRQESQPVKPPGNSQLTNTFPASYAALSLVTEEARTFNRVELSLETDGIYANPFDPAEADWWVTFTAPSGKETSVPAFWYQDFDRETLQPVGKPGWRVRFTPGEPGDWSAEASFNDAEVDTIPVHFTVSTDPAARGFIRIHPENSRYFAFSDGSLFFPVGVNMAWSVDDVLIDYERWLNRLSENGGNAIRLWMASWSFGIEWKDTGLGDYSKRMDRAYLLDEVFKMSEERGIYIMLALLNHGAFNTRVNPEWDSNPYNIALGGPLKSPEEFAVDPLARQYFQRRLRYIAARWGYSTHLWSFEWWNEVNWTPLGDELLEPWIHEMTSALRAYDPYEHLVSNSVAYGATTLWAMPEMSFSQIHDYTARDPVETFGSSYRQTREAGPGKPVVMGELGYSWVGENYPFNVDGIQLHNGLWAAPFSGYAGTAMYWWWDNYIDPLNLWYQYRGIARFLEGENLAQLEPGRAGVSPKAATALTLQNSQKALVWVSSNAYTAEAAQTTYEWAVKSKQNVEGWHYLPPTLKNLMLTVTGLADGVYHVFWFDPVTGEWGGGESISSVNQTIKLALPPLQGDLALKIAP